MITEEEVEKVSKIYDEFLSLLALHLPYLASFTAALRVVLSLQVETLAVSEYGVLIINPKYFLPKPKEEQFGDLMHEVFHLYCRHFARGKDKIPIIWNIATDCVINEAIKQLEATIPIDLRLTGNAIYAINVAEILVNSGVLPCPQNKPKNVWIEEVAKRIRKLSEEQIYRLLAKAMDKFKAENFMKNRGVPFDMPGVDGGAVPASVEPSDSVVVRPGDRGLYGPIAGGEKGERSRARGYVPSPRAVDDKFKEAITRSYERAAGKAPGFVERLVDRAITDIKINWAKIVRWISEFGESEYEEVTWSRPSRRFPDWRPGVIYYEKPKVWLLIDTSGSMSTKEIGQILTYVESTMLRYFSLIHIIPWDAKVHGHIIVRRRGDVRKIKALPGGGGTVIWPALEYTLKNMKRNEIVVIFSDFAISDEKNPKTKELAIRIARRGKLICISVALDPPFFCHRCVKVGG